MKHMAAFDALAAEHRSRLGISWSLPDGRTLMSLHRHKNSSRGNGAVAMREVCALADRLGVTLTLGTSVEKLKPWYVSFGFCKTKELGIGPRNCVTFFKRIPNATS
jgi:hypothetical protein